MIIADIGRLVYIFGLQGFIGISTYYNNIPNKVIMQAYLENRTSYLYHQVASIPQ